MKRLLLALATLSVASCEERVELARELSSFEVTLSSPVGSPERRCLLPGTSTTGVDLSGCPTYLREASGDTAVRLEFTARALDNRGELLESFNGLASVRVVPGKILPGFRQVRFENGVATGGAVGATPSVAFGASFGDTYLWLTDELRPFRDDSSGLGTACNYLDPGVCGGAGLGCVNAKPAVGFDADGLAYCTKPCAADDECPSGYFCSPDAQAYETDLDFSEGACLRKQPTYSAGVAGPIHFVEPNLADVNRSDSLITSPFQEEFVEVKRGNMVVTGVRIDGFYVTDTCPIRGYESDGQETCTEEERAQPPEFNHLFVFNFSRPEDLFPGDRLITVSGPMTEFNGLSELGFPLWEVDYERSPQPIPDPIPLSDVIVDHFPQVVEQGERCANASMNPQRTTLIECDFAMERLEGARITVRVRSTVGITPGSREDQNLERFGQWPVVVDDGTQRGRTFQLITRENIPFFDPRTLGAREINQDVTGNLRQVAFDDRSDPIWIVEPRDQADCSWCVNN